MKRHWLPLAVLAGLFWGVPCLAGEKAGQPTAEQVMIRAHQARAVWKDFPGFTAKVTLRDNGKTFKGKVTVDSDAEVVISPKPTEEFAWAIGKLHSTASHRMPSYRTEYDVSFADEETTHPLGRLIKFNGDSLHSLYRIRDDVITEVHRQMGESRFTISVMDVARNKQGKYLPRTYSVAYWNTKSGAMIGNHTSYGRWKRIGDFDLPTRLLTVKTSSDKREVQQIDLSEHKLLKPAKAP